MKPLSDKAVARLYLAALAAALLAFFAPALHGTFIFRDAFNLFYPYKAVEAGFLKGFAISAWNPWETLGSPFIGELATGWFYPGNVLWLLFDPEPAFRLFILGHFFLAAGLMWAWLRELRLAPAARLVGVLSYTLSGYVLSQNGLPDMLATAAWLPGSLLFATRLARGRRPADLAIFAVTLAMPFLCGRAEGSAMNAVASFVYFLFLPAEGQGLTKRFGRAVLTFAAAGALALALSMAQSLPSLELGRLSSKGAGFGLDEAMLWSFHPARMLEFLRSAPWGSFWPDQTYRAWDITGWPGYYPFALTEYLGIGALVGTIIYLTRAPRAYAAAFIAGLTAIIVLCFGRFTPLFAIVYRLVPGMTIFRYPEKLMLLAVLMLSAGGAAGTDRLLAWLDTRQAASPLGRRLPHFAAGAAVAAIVFLELFSSNHWVIPYADSSIYKFTPAAVALLSDRTNYRDRALFRGGLPVPGAFRVMREPMEPAPGALALVHGDNQLERRRRWERETMIPNFNFIAGYEFLTGYTAAATADFDRVMRGGISVKLMELYNVRYVISPTGPDLPGLTGFKTIGAEPEMGFRILRLPDTLPRAFLVGRSLRLPRPLDRLDLVGAVDFKSAMVLEDAPGLPPAAEESDLPLTAVTIGRYEAERVEVEADAPAAAWLVLSDSFYPGWAAIVDGRETPIFRANFLVRAVRVPAGRHEVVFEYRPRPLRAGLVITAAAWLFAAGLVVFGRRSRRPPALPEKSRPC